MSVVCVLYNLLFELQHFTTICHTNLLIINKAILKTVVFTTIHNKYRGINWSPSG